MVIVVRSQLLGNPEVSWKRARAAIWALQQKAPCKPSTVGLQNDSVMFWEHRQGEGQEVKINKRKIIVTNSTGTKNDNK